MLDLHCHILPGIDDGAADWETSLKMARSAADDGITGIVATPHHANGRYDNEAASVRALTAELNERLREEGIPVTVYSGQEIRVHRDFLSSLESGRLLTVADTRYILIEMPASEVPKDMYELVYELRLLGMRPIIAHPERNAGIVRVPRQLRELVEAGAYAQVTSHSLLGAFGRGIEKAAWSLCRQGLIHFVANDAHHPVQRGFRLNEAYKQIGATFGEEWASMYKRNARMLLHDEEVQSGDLPVAGTAASGWQRIRRWFGHRH
jgi:Capsular polysaccharide biosynthesis protein